MTLKVKDKCEFEDYEKIVENCFERFGWFCVLNHYLRGHTIAVETPIDIVRIVINKDYLDKTAIVELHSFSPENSFISNLKLKCDFEVFYGAKKVSKEEIELVAKTIILFIKIAMINYQIKEVKRIFFSLVFIRYFESFVKKISEKFDLFKYEELNIEKEEIKPTKDLKILIKETIEKYGYPVSIFDNWVRAGIGEYTVNIKIENDKLIIRCNNFLQKEIPFKKEEIIHTIEALILTLKYCKDISFDFEKLLTYFKILSYYLRQEEKKYRELLKCSFIP